MIIAPIPIIVAGITIVGLIALISPIPLELGSIPHRVDSLLLRGIAPFLLLRGIAPCLLLRRAVP